MNEQRILRIGAIVMATTASLGLAVTLAVQVTLWLGLGVLALSWGLVALRLIRLEQERLELENRRPAVEPFVVDDDFAEPRSAGDRRI